MAKAKKSRVKEVLENIVKDFQPEEGPNVESPVAVPSEYVFAVPVGHDVMECCCADCCIARERLERLKSDYVEQADDGDVEDDEEDVLDADDDTRSFSHSRRKLVVLELTLSQLMHLYDLMSVRLNPDEDYFVSEQLAVATGNMRAEEQLFEKVRTLCAENDIPIDDESFDHVVGQADAVKLGVFRTEER
jgi:hypothetical protein